MPFEVKLPQFTTIATFTHFIAKLILPIIAQKKTFCKSGDVVLEDGEIGSKNGDVSIKEEFSGSPKVKDDIDDAPGQMKSSKHKYSNRKKIKGEKGPIGKESRDNYNADQLVKISTESKTKDSGLSNLETVLSSEKTCEKKQRNISESKSGISSSQCEYCPFSLGSQKSGKYFKSKLRRHNKIEHHVCEICHEKCDSSDDLSRHMESVHRDIEGRMICGVDGCSMRPQSARGDLLEKTVTHVRVVHDQITYVCKECGKPYNDFSKHKVLHSLDPKSLFTCEECQYAFITEKSLGRHRRVTHPILQPEEDPEKTKADMKLPCNICDFKTSGLSQEEDYKLILHKKIHQNGEMICNKCPFKSPKRFTLKRHLAEEHNQGMVFQCTFCEYKTGGHSGKGHLKIHMARHSNEKNFQCDQCEFSGNTKTSLDRHIQRAHQQHAPKFLCDECDYKSGDYSNFDAHRRVRHGSEVLACEDCDYKTKSRRSLRDHKTKHSTRLICAICGFATDSEKNLRTHKSESHNNQ